MKMEKTKNPLGRERVDGEIFFQGPLLVAGAGSTQLVKQPARTPRNRIMAVERVIIIGAGLG
jgi:hypothetical protein